MPPEQARNGENRSDAHLIRFARRYIEAAIDQRVRNPRASARSRDMSNVMEAPSDNCDEFPAVTDPLPLLGSNTGFNASRPSIVVSGRFAFIAFAGDFLRSGLFTRLLVEQRHNGWHGRNLRLEQTFGLRASSTLLTDERVLVLSLASDVVALRHHLRRHAHFHVQSRFHGRKRLVRNRHLASPH